MHNRKCSYLCGWSWRMMISSACVNLELRHVTGTILFVGIPHYRIDVILSYYMDEVHLNKAKGGAQNRHQALYITSHSPTRGRFSVL